MSTPERLAELTPMGWACAVCGDEFPHGRDLIGHLLAEHPEIGAAREPG